MFPVPRITESFMDAVASDLCWERCAERYAPNSGRHNADYLSPGYIIELKILEEEGIEKEERQEKLSRLFRSAYPNSEEIDISVEETPESIRNELEKIVSGPIQTAVKKASRQIKETSEDLDLLDHAGVLLIVNCGYSYLNAETFETLVARRCANDSSRIAHIFCITVEYHQGDFDAYVFCTARGRAIRSPTSWELEEKVRDAVMARFEQAMTVMIKDQMNSDLWANRLNPIKDIRFEADGVRYVRGAPEVPDSRF